MAIYLVSFDLRTVSHDYEHLYRALVEMSGKESHPTAWLVESNLPLREISSQLLGYVTREDGLLVVEITPATPWAATRLKGGTGEWLKAKRP
ncbi:hypothetical protein [Methylobacterium sp. ID0610]|uniref:hypothetical protein n=1 Tax=Methylobacterium carpenticola TaxID=3344827 RepID=UPI00367B13FD